MKLPKPGKKKILIISSVLVVLAASGTSYALMSSHTEQAKIAKVETLAKTETKKIEPSDTSVQTPVTEPAPEQVKIAEPVQEAPAKYPYATEISEGIWRVTDTNSLLATAGIPAEDRDKVNYVINKANAWKFAEDGSFGIGQIDTNKVASAFGDGKDPINQMRWIQQTCIQRYGNWQKAYEKSQTGQWLF